MVVFLGEMETRFLDRGGFDPTTPPTETASPLDLAGWWRSCCWLPLTMDRLGSAFSVIASIIMFFGIVLAGKVVVLMDRPGA